MRNEQLLTELIQDAVTDYCYESGEDEFSVVITVATHDGWTEVPKIKMHDNHPQQIDHNGDNLPYWLEVASLAISAALNAVALIPANIDRERAQWVDKTLIELKQAQKTFTKNVASDTNGTRSPDN